MSRRSKTKFPNLSRDLNLKHRRYFIDTDYVNGVYDADGVPVIRPLNEEEKAFLDQFYAEMFTHYKNDGTDFYPAGGPERKEFYHNNYASRGCIYNLAHRTGQLKHIRDHKDLEHVSMENYEQNSDIQLSVPTRTEARYEESLEKVDDFNFKETGPQNYDLAVLVDSILARGDEEAAKKLIRELNLEPSNKRVRRKYGFDKPKKQQ